MSRYILKTGNIVLKNGDKIYSVGEMRPPVLDLNPSLPALQDNSPVVQWTDISGQNNHAVQPIAALQPVFKSNEIAGKPALEFNVKNMELIKTVAAKTIFIVAKLQSTGNFATLFGVAGGADNYFLGSEIGNSMLYNATNTLGGSAISNIYVNGSLFPKPNHILNYVNAYRLLTIDIGEASTAGNSILRVGSRDTNNYFISGTIARIVAFDYRLFSLDRQKFEQDLIAEYAL